MTRTPGKPAEIRAGARQRHLRRLITSLLSGSFTLASMAVPQKPDQGPPVDRLDRADSAYKRADEYSRQRGGLAVLVHRAEEVLFESYSNGHHPERPHTLASGTKSFWGLAAAAAVQDGLLALDEPASNTLTEWRADPRKAQITVRQLLNLTSGLEPAENELRGPGIADKFQYALSVPALSPPGEAYRYGPSHFFAFGELLKRKLGGEDPLAYLRRRILDPIGLEIGHWTRDASGNPNMPFGAYLTATEWIKVGELVRGGGRWGDRQVLDPGLLAECFRGSAVNPAYGLTWWLHSETPGVDPLGRPLLPSERLPADLVYAAGAGNQRLYLIPSMEMVVVRFGRSGAVGRSWSDEIFLELLLGLREKPPEDGAQAALADARDPRQQAERLLQRLDADGDGGLGRSEVPPRWEPFFRRLDGNADGRLDRDELAEAIRRRGERTRRR